ncbi:XRE family transcriptional regulator [Flavobacterium arcticum]|uniref:XRE family transcriptional regulator n=1 Tax=Flavobacterium arcticum TaxID=1784713 RepID=A0A345H8P9_9FLAO|nr:helix-turn-helix transcriptional regulator [Flavobacterium arcticum]AXG72959.1 XRE family transcriptional regulator [Flavobacterium arcticum]KAF2510377.1 helix-turn-helix transcriptional regulator [Flavobacterium arcticum]
MSNKIGLNINNLCKQNFLSKKEFADLFGVSLSTINTYTGGRSNPPIDLIQKICSHFELSIDDFINSDLSQSANNNKEALQQNIATETINNNKNAIIASQRETIETQKELIASLRSQLSQAS